MKTSPKDSLLTSLQRLLHSIAQCLPALALSASLTVTAADRGKAFASPEEAVRALATAARAADSGALRSIFGPAADDLVNADRVQATNELRAFTTALDHRQRILRESNSRCVLEVGENSWPFPVPIVQRDGQWFFDTAAGKDELLNRRIGHNELMTLRAVRAYVEAQREYAARDRDGDQVLEFAQKFISTAGLKDGLYWPPDLDGEISPLGPLVAYAQDKGYRRNPREESAGPEPFHGYLYKILTRQAKSAPGGKHSYLVNGNMIAGFALVAWPASYGETGVMTFVVNQQGRVYQKDLGVQTAKVAAAMKEYNPDNTWTISRE
jgi:hypothetical protein